MTDIRGYSSRRDSENVIASRKAKSRTVFTDKKTAFAAAFTSGYPLHNRRPLHCVPLRAYSGQAVPRKAAKQTPDRTRVKTTERH